MTGPDDNRGDGIETRRLDETDLAGRFPVPE
jgi:hypothetical protein